jgi:hypothetical protein
MPARLEVFCSLAVSQVTRADLTKALDDVEDLYTVAEGFGIEDESVVDAARDTLEIDGADGSFELRYGDGSRRPIQLEVLTDPARIRAIADEAIGELDPEYPDGAKQVSAHLPNVTEIAVFELGFSQLEDMGVVIAGQLAEWLARKGSGLIRDQHDDWWRLDDAGIPQVLIGPQKR